MAQISRLDSQILFLCRREWPVPHVPGLDPQKMREIEITMETLLDSIRIPFVVLTGNVEERVRTIRNNLGLFPKQRQRGSEEFYLNPAPSS